jgi:MFS family permease
MRAPFAAAAIAGFVGFALLGFITALVGSFLAKGLSDHSHQTAGVASCLVFAAAALAQVGAGRLSNHRASLLGLAVAPIGLGLITAALPARSLTLFVVGALVSGAGVGFAFRAAIVSITTRAPDERRGEVLATFFVIAYIGLTVPVVGTGVLVTDATLFIATVTLAIVVAVLAAVASGILLRLSGSAARRLPLAE